ncbi:MAG: protein translocase subunit SecD [Spirochaetales bacterium]|nr:protein translocase subunit SecD [Spirochaetales bacterium]
MKNAGRIAAVLLVLIVSAVLLYPSIKWYCFVSEDVKNLATGTKEEIRDYSRAKASEDVNSIKALGGSSSVPKEYSYLIDEAKDRGYKSNSWTVSTLMGAFKSESDLFSVVENHYRKEIMDAKSLQGRILSLGLDLKGGVSVLLEADTKGYAQKLGYTPSAEEISAAVSQDIEILSSRIDQYGVSEPDIRKQGDNQILIEIPGEADTERVNSFLQGKGSLYFCLVDSALTNKVNSMYQADPQSFYNERGELITPSIVPSNRIMLGYYKSDDYSLDVLESLVVLDPSINLDGGFIESSQSSKDSVTNRPVVNFTLSNEGGKLFYDLTSKHKGQALAVVLDEKVRSVATINDAISSNVQISGFNEKEAQSLAITLKSASFPIDLEIVSMTSVGATLGDDAVKTGLTAIVIGFALVIIFMVAYYSLAGLVADLALLLNLFIMISLLSALSFTVTLTSIAGLILTLGMAVDANVIIYERIKEELKKGKKPYQALESGFKRAFWTIMDSNVTTIIAALVLSTLGSSSVKGFAITLAIGIASSLFTSLYFSHFIFSLFIKEDSKKFLISFKGGKK